MEVFLEVTISILIIALIALLLLMLLYGLIRLLRLAEHWVIRVIAGLFALGGILCIMLLLQQPQQAERMQILAQESEVVGIVSCVVAVYSFSQWGARNWYLLAARKKRCVGAINRASRQLLLFFRRYHSVFGWTVLITAAGHAIALLPRYAQYSQQALVSGAIALAVLSVLIVLGMWIERAIRQKRLSAKVRVFHVATAITFFVLLLLHLSMK